MIYLVLSGRKYSSWSASSRNSEDLKTCFLFTIHIYANTIHVYANTIHACKYMHVYWVYRSYLIAYGTWTNENQLIHKKSMTVLADSYIRPHNSVLPGSNWFSRTTVIPVYVHDYMTTTCGEETLSWDS